MTKNLIFKFKDLTKNSVDLAGGKGASLGEMTNAGIIIPPGFVITAKVFDDFLKETDLNIEIASQLDKINYQDIKSIDEGSKIIRNLIIGASVSQDLEKEILAKFKNLGAEFVAVRSSATAEDSLAASWAGELETYLNTKEENLLENIKKCWSSLFTPRAIFYRNEKGLVKSKVSVAVVVQKMVQSEVSGICFTVHPVTEDKNQMIIEAGFGLGEAIVSGQITPDSYVVDKQDFSIMDININSQDEMIIKKGAGVETVKVVALKKEKQKLSGKEIIELAKLCVKIEDHYGFPCDIEWALESGKFYITQSRPITTLG